jgi:UbiD family decarboxylase
VNDLHPALARYRDAARDASRNYPDLHEHVLALARAGLLVVVDEPVNKDTEMHPLVRWQYRGGIPESERKAFLFTQATDGKGRRYDASVLVAGLAANRNVYRIGFGRPLDEIGPAWVKAIAAPIPPQLVENAPCHEVVTLGDDLNKDGAALDGQPVPISTPGFDNAPYLSAGHYISKDPDTGVQNVGNYRGQLKAPRRLGMNPSVELRAGIYAHWLKYKARGEPLPCAVVVGCPPVVSYASVQKMPENLDELAVAGALAGSPINVVRCKTIDLTVPAESEIVIEGLIDTNELEPEAPFGESHGYVNLQEYNAFMQVTAITRRRNPILTSFISQVAPSESSVIRRIAMEPLFLNHLRNVLSIRGIKRVSMHEPLTNLYAVIAIPVRARRAGDGSLACSHRRVDAASFCRQMGHRGRRGHRPGQCRRVVLGHVVPLPAAARYPSHPAQGLGARSARAARQRRECVGADKRAAEEPHRAGRAAAARIHGERQGAVGAARPTAAEAGIALARL